MATSSHTTHLLFPMVINKFASVSVIHKKQYLKDFDILFILVVCEHIGKCVTKIATFLFSVLFFFQNFIRFYSHEYYHIILMRHMHVCLNLCFDPVASCAHCLNLIWLCCHLVFGVVSCNILY